MKVNAVNINGSLTGLAPEEGRLGKLLLTDLLILVAIVAGR